MSVNCLQIKTKQGSLKRTSKVEWVKKFFWSKREKWCIVCEVFCSDSSFKELRHEMSKEYSVTNLLAVNEQWCWTVICVHKKNGQLRSSKRRSMWNCIFQSRWNTVVKSSSLLGSNCKKLSSMRFSVANYILFRKRLRKIAASYSYEFICSKNSRELSVFFHSLNQYFT